MAHNEISTLSNKAPEREQLTRGTWLDAASAAIAEGGFDDVRVLTLAKRLGVTRGSFYWHFHDHAELVVSFLDRWRDRRLAELEYLRASGDDTETELRRILRLALNEPAWNTRQMRVELAVRDFARRDAYAAKIVGEVDRGRIAHCTALLQKILTDRERAYDLALLLYVATIGGRVVLTGFSAGEAAINRIDHLISEILTTEGRSR